MISGESPDPIRFYKELESIIGKINAAVHIDEIMLDLSHDISARFYCERLTLYVLSPGKTHIESKVKTGLRSYKDFSLPISEESIAGYVALTKRSLNIADVYDPAELAAVAPGLKFMDAVDRRTGFHSREMLVAPLVNQESGELLGVVQLINNRLGGRFGALMEDGLMDLCETLSVVFSHRLAERLASRSKYDGLVLAGLLTRQELEAIQWAARRNRSDVQAVLLDEGKVGAQDIGLALARWFGTVYAPWLPGRPVPEAAASHVKWATAGHKRWLLLEDSPAGLVILCTDPDRVKGARIVNHVFPDRALFFQVTTDKEFERTARDFFGAAVDEARLGDLDSAASARALAERVGRTVNGAMLSILPETQFSIRAERLAGRGPSGGKLTGRLVVDYWMSDDVSGDTTADEGGAARAAR